MRYAVVGIALAMLATHASADSATAKAAFEQGEKLTLQNKWTEACPYFEASFRADPQLGALLALSECHEQTGRIASAWSELKDALELAIARGDARRPDIELAIKDLAPRVPKLKVVLPQQPIPGLKITRADVDLTVFAGTDIPTDAGVHEVIAQAPGYEPQRLKVTVKEGATTTLDIPPLAKVSANAPAGKLTVKSAPNAQITLDSKVVGTGSFEGAVKPGGHTLRVTAPGKRVYQTEITVAADDNRVIDVLLEDDGSGSVVVAPKGESGPSFEFAAQFATGFKNRNERPLVVAIRGEGSRRIGRRVELGTFLEYGQIQTSDRCGLDMVGPTPATEFDFGPRNQFLRCTYLMPGLQLYVHIRPRSKIDPYVGIAPGFRASFIKWREYVGGVQVGERDETLPAIVTGVRAGVNYHPTPSFKAWEVGAYFEASITVFGDEGESRMNNSDDGGGGVQFVTFFGGARTSLQF